MAQPTNLTDGFDVIGKREDLVDMIYNISPDETPFFTLCAKTTAKNAYHEWQTDTLATPAANRQIDGDDATGTAFAATTRLGNYCQISTKNPMVSRRADKTSKAGRASEMNYQLAKMGKELKLDVEYALVTNQASSAGGSATASSCGSLESWLASNKTSLGTAGTPTTPPYSGGVVSPTDASTPGTFVESALKTILQGSYVNGGDPKIVMVGPFNKTKASAFAGIATQYKQNTGKEKATIIGAADWYVGDFGTVQIVPNRVQRDRTAFVLDMDYWAVAFFDNFRADELPKTGDSMKKQLLVDFTLEARNEKASGKITDLTVT